MCVQGTQRSGEHIRVSGSGVKDGCELPSMLVLGMTLQISTRAARALAVMSSLLHFLFKKQNLAM